MPHDPSAPQTIWSRLRPSALAKGAHALLPLLVEFSVIAVAATLMGAGYAMALAWDRLTDLW
jgi:hypothetical protein